MAGTILDPSAGSGSVAGTVRDFELLLSEDGVTYETVLSGELSGALAEQAFVLPEPIPARFAQLRITSRTPGRPPPARGVEGRGHPGLAAGRRAAGHRRPGLGGHVAWVDPQPGDLVSLDAHARSRPSIADWLPFDPDRDRTVCLGAGLPGRSRGAGDGAAVDRSAGTRSRAAPPLALDWRPASRVRWARGRRSGPGTSSGTPPAPWLPSTLEAPTWARYIRMSATESRPRPTPSGAAGRAQRARGGAVRGLSVGGRRVGLWLIGRAARVAAAARPRGRRLGAHRLGARRSRRPIARRARGRPARRSGAAGATTTGMHVSRARAASVTARFSVSGRPTVGVGLTLFDEGGARGAHGSASRGSRPGTVDHVAAVIPGRTYRLLVDQPPFSVVVVYDTSASISGYVPIMAAALRSYTRGLVPGEEAVQLIDLEGDLRCLDEFSDDPWLIQNALDAHAGSSDRLQQRGDRAHRRLEPPGEAREGARAIFLMTDAETGSFHRNTELWHWLATRPARRSSRSTWAARCSPVQNERLMQDWAASGAGVSSTCAPRGHRAGLRPHGGLAAPTGRLRARARVLDRAPAADPKPGRLRVVSDPNAGPPVRRGAGGEGPRLGTASADVAVELVLDTSGSMLERLGRQRRIDVAKGVLRASWPSSSGPGTPVALRTFRPDRRFLRVGPGGAARPPGPGVHGRDHRGPHARPKTVRTPLAAAIAAVGEDLASVTGPRVVVVVSDGRESCGGDPEAAVRSLVDQGFDVSVNVVGLGPRPEVAAAPSRDSRTSATGHYYDARDADGLAEALKRRPRRSVRRWSTPRGARSAAAPWTAHRSSCRPAPTVWPSWVLPASWTSSSSRAASRRRSSRADPRPDGSTDRA